jgi:PAS domain S-box-containing protein
MKRLDCQPYRELVTIAINCPGFLVDRDFMAAILETGDAGHLKTELRQATDPFEVTFTESPIGMATTALDGSWMRVNRAMSHITGYTEPQLLKRGFEGITHPDDVARDLDAAEKLLHGELGHYETEKRYIRANGSHAWVRLFVIPVHDNRGNVDYLISQVQDRAIRELVLLGRDQQRGMAFDIHDFLVPAVGAISLRASLVRDRLAGDPVAGEHLARVQEESTRLVVRLRHMIAELAPPELDEGDLEGALRTQFKLARELLPNLEIDLSFQLKAPAAKSVQITIHRVVVQALRNSVQHAEPKRIWIELAHVDGNVRTRFSDDGSGIDSALAAGRGPGHVGIASMRERIEAAGGGFEITERTGGGTTVEFWLPDPSPTKA